jgi:hypothetical protein
MGIACAVYFRRNLAKWKTALVFILPIIIALYYYSFGLQGKFWFGIPLYKYYLASITLEIVLVSAVFLAYAWRSWLNLDDRDAVVPITFLLVALSLVYFSLMAFMKAQGLASQGGSPFAHRYLINLVPIGIMAMIIFSRALFQSFKDIRFKAIFIMILAAILAWRFFYAYSYAHAWIGI